MALQLPLAYILWSSHGTVPTGRRTVVCLRHTSSVPPTLATTFTTPPKITLNTFQPTPQSLLKRNTSYCSNQPTPSNPAYIKRRLLTQPTAGLSNLLLAHRVIYWVILSYGIQQCKEEEIKRDLILETSLIRNISYQVVTICTAQWSLYVPHSGHYMYHQFNIQQLYVLPTQCIYVFCVDLRTNSHYFPIQH